MTIQWITALTLGFLGSLHCLGMCGPLVLAMPLQAPSKWRTSINFSLYHFSRIFAYGLLGLLPGIIGEGLLVTGTQQWLSLVIGIVFIIAAIFSFRSQLIIKVPGVAQVSLLIQNLFKSWMQKEGHARIASMGFLNGFIPCGMVYMAMAAALGSEGLWGSMSFMMIFGVGTIPIFLLLLIFQRLSFWGLQKHLNKLIPASLLVIGLLFIYRGVFVEVPLDLGILRIMGWDAECH